MPLVIGLTGGIGSGKSVVADAFAQLGVPIVDADAIAHELSAVGAAGFRAVTAAFGPEAIAADGSLHREWLRKRAFADPAFRTKLEALLHPLIRAESELRVGAWSSSYGILVVPLLLERSGGARRRVDRVLVVDCPEEVQIRRVMARSNLTESEVRAIMATQLPRAERLAQADDVIDNSGEVDHIAEAVMKLDARYQALAQNDARA